MPGTITHLAIANRIINELPDGIITNEGLFYAGAIAPDAIHAREGFVRANKKHTHMRDNIADIDFGNRDNLALFHNRVTTFINDNMSIKNSMIDLYRGYVVHVLTDEIFLLTIRPKFVIEMNELGIVPTDILFYTRIMHDLNSNDFRLLKDNGEMKEICNLIKNLKPYCVDGYLTEEELNISRNWLMKKYFSQEHKVSEPVYISYNRMLRYIEDAAYNIIGRLSDGVMFPKVF